MSQLARTADTRASQVVVKPVTSWWQRRQFLNVPWDIYGGDLNWVPPLRGNAKEMVNYTKHPFYDNAEIQTFLAYRNGTPVGRVAAIVYRAHNERYHEKRGFFGLPPAASQAWQLPSVGCPANGSSPSGVKMRTK